jgi:OOP family OmpA-OmpF porin
LFVIALTVMCAGACATPGAPPAMDIQAIPDGVYQQKVDVLYVVLDASASMAEGYNGLSKFETARSVVGNFNATMPDVTSQVALRSFGHDAGVSNKSTALMVPLTKYNPALLSDGLNKVTKAGGISPLERALKAAGEDLAGSGGPMAMVIVSDGKDMGKAPLDAAKALAAAQADQLCIHTVLVGNDRDGSQLLSQVADDSRCGKTVTADSLASGAAMNAFVKEVLLSSEMDSDRDGVIDSKDRCPDTPRGVKVDMAGCPLDSDQDGVPDHADQCPDTPLGAKVDGKGCPLPVASKSAEVTAAGTWIYKDIQFEINKADLRQVPYPFWMRLCKRSRPSPS